jgi:hypothetical protein
MGTSDREPPSALGFLTVVEHEEHGLFGGYLVTSLLGRPLEFHCTTPVKPNRAQQILYGPTLEPYLYGEQIGLALASKATIQPRLVCTDVPPVLALRPLVSTPVVLIESGKLDEMAIARDSTAEQGLSARIDPPHGSVPPRAAFTLLRHRLAVSAAHAGDPDLVRERLADLPDYFDLSEPFTRIREAIEEAQRLGK